MKRSFILVLFTIVFASSYAQETVLIEDNEVTLIKAADGQLDLFWCIYLREYRFFVKTANGTLTELNESGSPDYKTQLLDLTNNYKTTSDLKYRLNPLTDYINDYNASQDPNYVVFESANKLKWNMAAMGGITNNPFVTNGDNTLNPMLGLELEVAGNVASPKHSGFVQLRHAFKSDEFEYQTTEFSLGYRYRFLRKDAFNVFAQVKFATLNFSDASILNAENTEVTITDTSFDIPFIFGIGTDIKLGENSHLTFIYGELFALFLNNQGNFPLDFSVGYRFNL